MNTATKERPILFRPELVRKILDGKKTQTRRPVKAANVDQIETDEDGRFLFMHAPDCPSYCDYACAASGEIFDKHIGWTPWGSNPKHWGSLWVRETWARCIDNVGIQMVTYRASPTCGRAILFADDGEGDHVGTQAHDNVPACTGPWKPSIHMPRWACRLRLEIKDVRVERVQDISEADAVAEGMERIELTSGILPDIEPPFNRVHPMTSTYAEAFRQAWEKAYKGSWQRNDWVWVLSFEVCDE